MKTPLLKGTLTILGLAISGLTGSYAQGIITTIAGTGSSGTTGDGGPATAARIAGPTSVTTNAAGDVYIVYNNTCRIISATTGNISSASLSGRVSMPSYVRPSASGDMYITDHIHDQVFLLPTIGSISAACGTGSQGHGGDGGHATRGTLMIPAGACVDMHGNIYIADKGSNAIRMVNSSGMLSTIAGNSYTSGFSGDGGPATAARLSQPNGICIDRAGNIYFSDAGNSRIRKISTSGVITTYAGNGSRGYSGDGGMANLATINYPAGMSIDNTGNLFFADYYNNRVRMITPSRLITTIAGTGTAGFSGDGGPGDVARLNYPSDVWVNNSRELFIADMGNNRIRKVDLDAGRIHKSSLLNETASDDIVVFPNPSTGELNIVSSESLSGKNFDVFNIVGAKVYSSTISETQTSFTLAQPAGIYFISVDGNNGRITKQITIAK